MTSMMDRLSKNEVSKPAISMVYGVHGIGKTSLGASSPEPVFLQTEDGLGTLRVDTFGLLRTYDEVMQAIGDLYAEPHAFKTVVLDSMDHLEPLVWAQACKDNGWVNIEAAGYGKGYVAALDLWRVLFDGIRALRDSRGMGAILLAHSTIKRFDSPEADPYDRYIPKMHRGASELLQEACDNVFFANYRISTIKADAGFNKSVTRAVGGGDRILYTQERPAFLAKNRYDMPPSIPMTWDAIAEYIPPLAPSGSASSADNAPAANAA